MVYRPQFTAPGRDVLQRGSGRPEEHSRAVALPDGAFQHAVIHGTSPGAAHLTSRRMLRAWGRAGRKSLEAASAPE
ncbi:hypothetical protein San01_08520 [Streptomyces angustmyceticus]|uniref:Uncharacterized protein n=1 Tax=Streptomyces angustmyceticus TaxID=285578 RepID=A0A5J4LE07_9ACTN|nr:hypothetical protein San01_08520 [Streptomyces angustmyceticus]